MKHSDLLITRGRIIHSFTREQLGSTKTDLLLNGCFPMITIISLVPKHRTPPHAQTYTGQTEKKTFSREINMILILTKKKLHRHENHNFIYEFRFSLMPYFVAQRDREWVSENSTAFSQKSPMWPVQYVYILLSCNKIEINAPKLIHFCYRSFFPRKTIFCSSFNEFAFELNRSESSLFIICLVMFLWFVWHTIQWKMSHIK